MTLISGRAVALDASAREVVTFGWPRLEFTHCVIATGAEPTRLPVPGADDPAVRVVRSLDHVRELHRRLPDGTEVVVIGSGFIGCEIAASLRRRGLAVTLISDERSRTRHGSERRPEPRSHDGSRRRRPLGARDPVDAIERNGDRLEVTAGSARRRRERHRDGGRCRATQRAGGGARDSARRRSDPG